jgi:hypothetical protein
MRLIYLSTDELNQSLVRAWCELRGIDVECPRPKDRARDLTHGGLLIDLDHCISEWLCTLARRLKAPQHGTGRVAGHGTSPAAEAFRRAFHGRQLNVSSRLGMEVLREFARDSSASASERPEGESDTLTWVNLA